MKLVDCVQTPVAGGRSATFEARARATAGTERMQVRFTLQARADAEGGGWRRVVHPAFDEWIGSAPGVRKYSFARTVRNLSAPAAYRAVVRFRWLDERGRGAQDRPRRLPGVPAARPAARSGSHGRGRAAAAADAASRRYAVTVRNGGRTTAGPFKVGLRVGDVDLDPLAVSGLAAGESRTVSINGPACVPGDALAVTVDPEDSVDERGEDDNLLAATCPAPPSAVTSSPGPARSRA